MPEISRFFGIVIYMYLSDHQPPHFWHNMLKPELIKIVEAKHLHDYVLSLKFNSGEVRECDFWPLSQKGVCKKLQDMNYFLNFTLDPYTVDWNNEIGFAPEFLYEVSVPQKSYNFESPAPSFVADDSKI